MLRGASADRVKGEKEERGGKMRNMRRGRRGRKPLLCSLGTTYSGGKGQIRSRFGNEKDAIAMHERRHTTAAKLIHADPFELELDVLAKHGSDQRPDLVRVGPLVTISIRS